MADLTGKVALVTGAAKERGIGRAIALKLASLGADIVIADLCKDKSESDEMWGDLNSRAKEIEALGRSALPVHVDITDEKAVAEVIAAIKEKFGRLDIVVNNAGAAFGMNLSFMMNPADWRKMIDINLTGTFLVARAAAQWMVSLRNGGAIINISSWRGRYPFPFLGAYCAAKSGVIALTEVMALELASHKIRVNAVCPGKVDTDMERMAWKMKSDAFGKPVEKIIEEEIKKIPLGKIASPDTIAGVVAFLASDDGSYMTGQHIYVTGGMTLMNV